MKTKTQKTVAVKSPEELTAAAEILLGLRDDIKVFALYGEMGSGKTTFVKAVCEIMGVKDNVSSPTFSIVNEYLTKDHNIVYHFDFYRIKNETEAYDLGFEDYIYSGNLCFIEWPDKVAGLLPEHFIRIEISEDNLGHRKITFYK